LSYNDKGQSYKSRPEEKAPVFYHKKILNLIVYCFQYALNTVRKIKSLVYDLVKEPGQLFSSELRKERSCIRRARRAMHNKLWGEAVKCLQEALQEGPGSSKGKAFIYRELARCYVRLNEPAKVEGYMKAYLEFNLGSQLQDVIRNIQNKLYFQDWSGYSHYVYLGGRCNYGFIEHRAKEIGPAGNKANYLTKIARAGSTGARKEKIFYLTLREQFPHLKNISPLLVDFTEKIEADISFLTLEKINGEISDDKRYMDDIIEAHKIMSEINYDRIKDYIEYDDLKPVFMLDDLRNFPGRRAKHTLASIYSRNINQKIINWLDNKVRAMEEFEELKAQIDKLKHLILEMKMYERLSLEENYCLTHGDFNKTNFLKNQEGKFFVLDWGSYLVAPKGYDLAHYFRRKRLKWQNIERNFLARPEKSGHLTELEKIFFIYTLVVLWFMEDFSEKPLKESHVEFLIPAMAYMEKLAIPSRNKTDMLN